MILLFVVGSAGGIGAALRYAVDRAVTLRLAGPFPWGTTFVNVGGAFLLGVLAGLAWFHGLGARWGDVLGTGFSGGLTTWSTASWETVRLVERGSHGEALFQAVGGLVAAALAAAIGVAIATA